MDVRRLPEWWIYPIQWGNGHGWGPGRVIVSWMPCLCDPAREAQEKGPGHRVIAWARTLATEYPMRRAVSGRHLRP